MSELKPFVVADAATTTRYAAFPQWGLPPPVAAEELKRWAESDISDDLLGGRSALAALLSLDGLVAAAVSGVIGSAAWSLFPAAAEWLAQHQYQSEPSSDADEVAAKVRACLEAIEPASHVAAEITAIERIDDGWRVRAQMGSNVYAIRSTPSGEVISLERRHHRGS